MNKYKNTGKSHYFYLPYTIKKVFKWYTTCLKDFTTYKGILERLLAPKKTQNDVS